MSSIKASAEDAFLMNMKVYIKERMNLVIPVF